ncbi:hypothetical protein EYF80_022076 [Liparis tanakae]|uniref:Uncharacterized protein n=1 Tax=Liparis tanakae TaxID=230148 RepID=A0A4Z2HQA6_9TELE|nr:hypothetical protein EYF80_022076 [Liparis tanakae]
MVFIPLPVSEAFPVFDPSAPDQKLFCFTCEDKDRCPKLTQIYETNGRDTLLYQRGSNEPIPGCSGVPTDVHNRPVCLNKSGTIIIISSQNKIDVEDENGTIPVIGMNCMYNKNVLNTNCTTSRLKRRSLNGSFIRHTSSTN